MRYSRLTSVHRLLFTLSLAVASCRQTGSLATYPTIDYLTVRRKLDTLNADLNTHGYRPTVTRLTNGRKQLTFFGASHVRTPDHPQFRAMERAFAAQQPQVAFNEGGQFAASQRYSSADSAIAANGESGLLKYLCDQRGIAMLDGDMTTKDEFAGLLRRFPKDQVYLYIAVERFLNPYRQGYHNNLSFEAAFQREHVAYLEQNGVALTAREKTIAYLNERYRHYFHQPLDLRHLVEMHDYYLTDTGIFGRIGRASKTIRDQALLTKIDNALDTYDRVFVVFGASHWAAVQPALTYIINKPR